MHDDLAHRLAVLGYIIHFCVDDAHAISGYVALTLPGKEARLFGLGKVVPLGVPFADGVRSIGFCQTIDMNWAEV